MNLRLRLRGWAVNVLLLLASFYIVLGVFTFVNLLNIEYAPFLPSYPRNQPMNLVFLSPFLDQASLYVLSSLMLILPLVAKVWKRASRLMLLSYFFLGFRFILYFFDVAALGEVFLVFAGFGCLTFILIDSPASLSLSRKAAVTRFLVYICCILLVVEFLSAICLFLYPFYGDPFLLNYPSVWRFVDLEGQLFVIFTGLTPFLIVIVLFSWGKPLMRYLKSLRKVSIQIQHNSTEFKASLDSSLEPGNIVRQLKTRYSILILTLSMILAFFYALYPYFPSINPERSSVGADIPAYVRMLGRMEESSQSALSYAFISARGLSLLLLHGLRSATGLSACDAAQFTPIILAPLLVLVAYLFVRQADNDLMIPSLAALFTASSHQVTLGLQAGWISNWMGLVETYLFLGLLFKSLRGKSWRLWSFATLTMILLLFTHAYTWGMLMGVLGFCMVLLGFLWWWRRGSSFEFKMLTVMVVVNFIVNLVVDVVKDFLLGSAGVAEKIASVAQSELAFQNLTRFWQTLGFVVHYWIGNFCTNSLIFYLALLGVFILLFRNKPLHRYLVSLLVVSSLPFVLADSLIQVRLLYNLPVQIFACFGLVFLLELTYSRLKFTEGKFLRGFLLLLIILVDVNCGLRCMFMVSNLS